MSSQMIDTLEARQMFSAAPQSVGYLPDWEANQALVSKIDWSGLTQVNYFSVVPKKDGNIAGASGAAANSLSGYSLSQLRSAVTAAHSHGVKVSIVIGGAGDAPTHAIENVLRSTSLQTTFAKSIATFIKTYKLDGVDFDYEPSGPSNVQITAYGNLIKKVNDTLPLGKSISAAVAAETLPNGNNWSDRRYVLNSLAVKSLDTIGVMTYDFTPGQGYSDTARSLSDLDAWGSYVNRIQAGSKSKLQLGLPFYGRAGGSDWSYTGTTGEATYADIIHSYTLDHNGALPSPSADSLNVWLGADVMDGEYADWYFNGPNTIQSKTTQAFQHGAGGVMIWDLGQDYFTPAGQYDQAHSLLPAVKRGVLAGTGKAVHPAVAQASLPSMFSTTQISTTRVIDGVLV